MVTTQKARVLGVTSNKGDFEGQAYDYTKVFVMTEMDPTDGKSLGSTSVEYRYGRATNVEQFRGQTFPLDVEVDFADVASPKGVSKRIVMAVRFAKPVRVAGAA